MADDLEDLQNALNDSSVEAMVIPDELNSDKQEEQEELPPFQYTPLDVPTQEMRFLILNPRPADGPMNCSMSIEPLAECKPYTYVLNTRGNPLAWLGFNIDGHVNYVTRNIAMFLLHIQSRDVPQRLWFRDVCINHRDPEEKARYWNEEWMDNMIQHAEKTIDLSEVMAEQWDKGELTRPFPPKPKDWNETREPKGTKYHPAPLHMQKGFIEPPPPHEYLPLDYVCDEFRLITLWAAENYNDPLNAAFAYSVMHDDVSYHCLSYAWGPDEIPTYPILLNGQMFRVRQNLDRALRKLRHNLSNIVIWVDAICINQDNVPERNRQLPRMLEIYDAADVVISWVGESDEASDTAIDFLDELKSPKLQQDGEGNWGPYTHKEGDAWKITPIPDLPRRLAALYRFFLRPYFRRIWVIQELAVASFPTLFCGKKQAAWSQLDMAAYHLCDILHCSSTMPARIIATDPALNSISDREISFIRRLFYFRHLRSKNADNMLMGNWRNISNTSPGILDAMILGRDFESSSPHDKIFALLNLAQDIEGIEFKPDYSKTLSQTYQDFAIAVANKTRSLDIICAAEPSEMEVPSWTVDWNTPSTVSSLIRHEHIPNVFMSIVPDLSGPIYSASGPFNLNLTPRFSFSIPSSSLKPILEVAGIILDAVKIVQQKSNTTSPGTFIPEWMFVTANEIQTLEENEWEELNTPFMQKFWSMLAGDSTGVWSVEPLPREEWPPGAPSDLEPSNVPFRPTCVKEDKCKHQLQNTSADVFSIVTRGRALIITENGLMGLAPHYVEVGQKLAILSRCSVPVLLEENEDGTYEFRGSAFVQGWMEGEVLEEMGLDSEEAWEVLDEGGRLRIV